MLGCAKDIVELAGVPRFLFNDFPLGNPAARTTVQSPLCWFDDPDWKLDYSNAARLSADEIARRQRGEGPGE